MANGSARWQGSFALKIAGTLGVITLGDWLFYQRTDYLGAFGLVGLAIVAALGLARPAVRHDRRAMLALLLAALAAFAMIWDGGPLPFALFWVAIGLATLLPGTARFDDGWRWLQRLLVHGLKALAGPLIDLVRLARIRRRRPMPGKGARYWFGTLAVPLAGSAVFLVLFAAANPLIARFLAAISITLPGEMVVARLVLWAFLALITWGVLRPRPPRRLLGTFDGRCDAVLPGVSPKSVTLALILFNALFAVQNGMDLAYLWGPAALPDDITLAEYAHRGAYPLVATALLAALFVLGALRPGSQTALNPLVRRLVAVWIAQNLLLVGNAALRTWDYVQAYDLTRLRIAALLWMALVGLGLVLVLWRMLREKNAAWLINANLAAASALLFALCFVDTGTIAARWNLAHARETQGTGAGLDWCYLDSLGASALLPLAELESAHPASAFGTRAAALRGHIQLRMESERADGGWTLLNNRRLDAVHRLLGPAADRPQPPLPDLGCYRDHGL